MAVKASLGLLLVSAVAFSGCIGTIDDPDLSLVTEDTPTVIGVILTNADDSRDLNTGYTDFRLVSPTNSASNVWARQMVQDSRAFPTTITLGPGENANGLLYFDVSNQTGTWTVKYESTLGASAEATFRTD